MLNSDSRITDQLTVMLVDVPRFASNAAESLICSRCHNIEEIVIKVLEIPSIGGIWSLCGKCLSELPKGFRVI
jgi:hypothetical protein